MEPGEQTGQHRRLLGDRLPVPDKMYDVPAPFNLRRSPQRAIRYIPFRLIWATIAEELKADSATMDILNRDPDWRGECAID
eukprot:1742415-Pyramimonas_sp.AAC.1